jgi:putative ABC transport system permease protein
MLKNLFTVAWRNILRNRGYSALTIFGLGIGMAVVLLIGLWISDELSFDTYHANYDRLAQLMTTMPHNGELETGPAASIPMAMELRAKRTNEFRYTTITTWNYDHILAAGDKKISRSGMAVQPEFPSMLTLKMLSGSRDALKDPSSILLSASVAKALFGNEDPMNGKVKVDNKADLKVAGVFEDLPGNTTLNGMHFLTAWDKFVSLNDWVKSASNQWGNHSFQCFVQLKPGVDILRADKAIRDMAKTHDPEGKEQLILQPMKNWRLYGDFKNGNVAGGHIQFVWLFGIIGLFVLILACINFMNLSTARSERRSKEIGIRKTLGSLRSQLIWRLLGESVLVAALAGSIAILLASISLPYFNHLSAKSMSMPWANINFWMLTLAFTLFTGLISGSYPAFYLSSFKPINVLKGTFKVGRLASLPRKILVVVQFTVSFSLIVATIIVFRQIQYARNRPAGYTRERLITVAINTPELNGHYNALRNDLLQTGVVADMAESNGTTTEITSNQIGFDWKGKDPRTTPAFGVIAITHDYGRTVGWKIKEGRDFSRNFSRDTGDFILNESAVRLTGLKNPIGQTIKWNGEDHQITGVVRDMVMESPYTPVTPSIFFLYYGWTQSIIIKLKPSTPVQDALAKLAPVFKTYNPGAPFEYQFADQEYALKFSEEQRIGDLAAVFAILAIFISCLGLFGLASFVAEQRTREMGVRKVLGASVFRIWQLLSREFVLLVIISCLISAPLAWYYLNQWLQKYDYHTSIPWWIFIVAGCGALAVTVLTVSYQAVRAALANPVKSLRAE